MTTASLTKKGGSRNGAQHGILSKVAFLLCLLVVRSDYAAVSRAKGIEMEQPAPARSTDSAAGDGERGNSAQSGTMRTEKPLGFEGSSLSVWSQELTYNKGWDVEHPRLVGDFDGDGKDDIDGFGNENVMFAITDSPYTVYLPLVIHHGSGSH